MTRNILTVDDSESIRHIIGFCLRQADFDTIEAKNGNEALEKLRENNVAMMITDLDMPEMGGIDLIRRARMIPRHAALPIIVLTTESATEIKHKARSVGANGWITKPFTPKQLLAVVEKVL